MLYFMIGMASILGYQIYQLRRQEASQKERRISLSVTGVAFIFGTLSIFRPEWVNPSKAIQFLFQPIQSFIMQG